MSKTMKMRNGCKKNCLTQFRWMFQKSRYLYMYNIRATIDQVILSSIYLRIGIIMTKELWTIFRYFFQQVLTKLFSPSFFGSIPSSDLTGLKADFDLIWDWISELLCFDHTKQWNGVHLNVERYPRFSSTKCLFNSISYWEPSISWK